jgi:hypothetical protein
MDALMLVIAAVTLAILIWQEWRRHQERPFPRIDVKTIGWLTDKNDERWELVEVSNSGNAPVVIDSTFYIGLRVLSSGQPDGSIAFGLPRILAPGAHVRLGMQGEDGKPHEDGYLRLMWHLPEQTTLYLQWIPVVQDSALGELEQQQAERANERMKARRRPKFWTRRYWRETLPFKPVPVGPVQGGVRMMRVTPKRTKKHPDLISIAVSDGKN